MNTIKQPLGFKTLITPTEKGMERHREKLKKIIKVHQASTQEKLIEELNPVIRGWSNYYSTVVSSHHFSKLANWMYQTLHNWAFHRHAKKSSHWIMGKYWLIDQGGGWRFAARSGKAVRKISRHKETPIKRHIKVQNNRSPYDGDWVYWSTRMGTHPETNKRVSFLLKRQKGKCPHGKLFFKVGDMMELTILSHANREVRTNTQTYNCFTAIAMTLKPLRNSLPCHSGERNSEVCMTNTITLRSRVR